MSKKENIPSNVSAKIFYTCSPNIYKCINNTLGNKKISYHRDTVGRQ